MNSAHILTRYEPKATSTVQPDGTLLIEHDLLADTRYTIALFIGFAMNSVLIGTLWAVVRHLA